ncbi:hypothetical protein LXA43DRAFT_640709 [Ganoderma leucocontextum]|nr:hypothetical protein LXA43DRAFT_640709 [Ganoderma leucocontextum]
MAGNDTTDEHEIVLATRKLTFPSNVVSHQDACAFVYREAETRRQIIQAYTDEIRNLHLFQNTFAPVNGLPPEIFSHIFAYLLGPSGAQPTVTNHADFITATHICRHWRAIAHANPVLWTSFPVHDLAVVEACLARSRELPIILSLTKPMAESVPDLVASSSHRVRSIWISTKEVQDVERLLSCFTAAHLLESLHVDSTSKAFGRGFERIVEPSVPILFKNQVPSLRHLALHDVQLFFTPPSTLRHLELFAFGILFQPLKDILEILANCPELEEVDLRGLAPRWEPVHRAKVQLPKLRSLSLRLAPAKSCARLLSQLSAPKEARIRVDCRLQPWEDYGDVIEPYSRSALHSLQCLDKMRNVHVHWSRSRLQLQASDDPSSIDNWTLDIAASSLRRRMVPYPVPRLLDGRWPFDGSHVERLAMKFDQYGFFPDIGGVHQAGGLFRMRAREWAAVLDATPVLKSLSVSGLYSPELDPLIDTLTGGEGDEVLCPKLESFELEGAQISETTMERVYRMAERRLLAQPGTFKTLSLLHCERNSEHRGMETYYGDEWAMKLMRLGLRVEIEGQVMEEEPFSWADAGSGSFSRLVFVPYRDAATVDTAHE